MTESEAARHDLCNALVELLGETKAGTRNRRGRRLDWTGEPGFWRPIAAWEPLADDR